MIEIERATRYDPRSLGRAVVVIPTYDEADNIASIVRRIRAVIPSIDLLIVDDESPDGTGKIADQISQRDSHVKVLHRTDRSGLGAAYLHGFQVALDDGYDVICEMDADGSHQPEQLPDLLRALEGADLALGSRWIPGGSVVDWPLSRRLLSRLGNLYIRLLLGVAVKDATGGFRAFKRTTLEKIALDRVRSVGYCFQADLVRRTEMAGLSIVEVPIEFVERRYGDSKMTRTIAWESLVRVTYWGLHDRLKRVHHRTTQR